MDCEDSEIGIVEEGVFMLTSGILSEDLRRQNLQGVTAWEAKTL